MIVLWLMLVGVAAGLILTAGRRPAPPPQAIPVEPTPPLPVRSVAFLNWLTNLIGASLAALLTVKLWRRRR